MGIDSDTLLRNRYRIVDILGQGGMGSVYRAVDENLGMEVAVKENFFTTEEYARQFRLEAVLLASMRHPNLPRVTDHFLLEGQGQYLVMDYIAGEDLRQRMDRVGTLQEDEAINVGVSICDALSYLHSREPAVLHRDVKPGNVKIAPDGHIYLVDFGLAKVMEGNQLTTTGARAMTPGYSPPEQYGSARTDQRTDIYSLGATLYAALTGAIPEDGLSRAMDDVQLTPLRKRNPKVSRRLAIAIEKAMAVDPPDRFQTADEFKQALLGSASRTQQAAGTYVVTPPPDYAAVTQVDDGALPPAAAPRPKPVEVEERPFVSPRKKRLEQEKQRRKTIARVIIFVLLLGIAAGAFFFPDVLPAEWRAMLPFIATEIQPTKTQTATQVVATTVPTDTSIPTATSTRVPPTMTKKAEATSTSIPPTVVTETVVAVVETSTAPITFTGGGTGEIAFASNRSGVPQIYLSDLSGTNITQITNMEKGACQPSWSPDGMKLVFTSPCPGMDEFYYNSSLYVINMDGSNLTPLPTAPGGDFDPAWSPDGTRIAFASMRNENQLDVYALNLNDNSTERLTLTGADDEPRWPAWSPDGKQIAYSVKRFDAYQLWLMTDAGADQQQIIRSGTTLSDYLPAWTPDGLFIIFNQRSSGGLIYFMQTQSENRPDEQGSRMKITPSPVEDADVSPDGQWIVFEGQAAEGSSNKEIFYSAISGGDRLQLTSASAMDFDPAWRPLPR